MKRKVVDSNLEFVSVFFFFLRQERCGVFLCSKAFSLVSPSQISEDGFKLSRNKIRNVLESRLRRLI